MAKPGTKLCLRSSDNPGRVISLNFLNRSTCLVNINRRSGVITPSFSPNSTKISCAALIVPDAPNATSQPVILYCQAIFSILRAAFSRALRKADSLIFWFGKN